jgi:hypothetical protein
MIATSTSGETRSSDLADVSAALAYSVGRFSEFAANAAAAVGAWPGVTE